MKNLNSEEKKNLNYGIKKNYLEGKSRNVLTRTQNSKEKNNIRNENSEWWETKLE